MIHADFIKTGVNYKTEAHYRRLGYEIERIITIRATHLPPASSQILFITCDFCGDTFHRSYHTIFKNRVGYSTGTKDLCSGCCRRRTFNADKYNSAREKIKKANEQFEVFEKDNYTKGFYVYRFLDKSNKIIYIGITSQRLTYRMSQHFNSGHLPDACYSSVDSIEFARVSSEGEMRIYEIFLINKHEPIYNTDFNNKDTFTFLLPDLNWEKFKGGRLVKTYREAI
jgi:hypothetical protein